MEILRSHRHEVFHFYINEPHAVISRSPKTSKSEKKLLLTNMTLFHNIYTSCRFFLLLCSFKCCPRRTKKKDKGQRKIKRKASLICKTMESPARPFELLGHCRHTVPDSELCGWKLFAAR